MTTLPENSIWLQKTRDLCAALVGLPEFQNIRSNIERFAADPELREQLQQLNERGGELQQKQQFGLPLDDGDVAEFEALREGFLDNPVARDFLDAQEGMRQFQQVVGEHVAKTFELGRVPLATDFPEECGSDCGCGTAEN